MGVTQKYGRSGEKTGKGRLKKQLHNVLGVMPIKFIRFSVSVNQ